MDKSNGSTASEVARYYRDKEMQYDAKYKCGYYTHIHIGLFPAAAFPMLHSSAPLDKLGLAKIRHYLHWGQESLVNTLLTRILSVVHEPKAILDCGAGHGGTSLYIADNFRLPVTALTISEEQRRVIQERADESGNLDLVTSVVGDIFEIGFPAGSFSAALGIDSFSQMGRPTVLFSKIYEWLEPAGILAISDCFAASDGSHFEAFYNHEWCSRIMTVQQIVDAALVHGFTMLHAEHLTADQLPSWRLSIAYSEILLRSETLTQPQASGLRASIDRHKVFLESYERGEAAYYQLLFRRSDRKT